MAGIKRIRLKEAISLNSSLVEIWVPKEKQYKDCGTFVLVSRKWYWEPPKGRYKFGEYTTRHINKCLRDLNKNLELNKLLK